ncbi:adaptin N terminal region-domain-containing protein [Gilbertella persicaria]|uniref:adaptin N terminal region-domain-containing protein n=1 Tax=Gilbertella persicaria TaxID=101096 RepID=UPI00222106D9|nr:adaptin N terminal region-domain-containing protein [Gilbertella persicaria]KAI8071153.1 adaptin N terminal region-domain-containing protein [Gilbertella persicaria]
MMKNINKISQEILAKLPLFRLKDLIRAVRACKTAAEERAVIQKESANIRTAFKNENPDTRHTNVAKLLYIHMLGYPAHFGQMECLKLVASPKYADKRLGYLGIMLLIDEKTEVLTLVTNSLKNDLNHSNMFVVGLALCTMGNISSSEMARDLCSEVEKLMGSSNTYIRKKAALCALRVILRVPELAENFISRSKSLLNDRSHGVLITGITLVTEMCQQNPDNIPIFRKAVPLLVRHLKNLASAGFSPEHDVTGVTDPFLQVKILRLLRILAKDDREASESMNDILAQVATNTENNKNVGNSILYETVLTIMNIQSEAGLRVLAVNILGKFLSNRDNNIRYVALETLNKTVGIETQAVQRHRNIILDCLRDGDISIRRRALELSFALINEGNVRVLTRELLAFLEVADTEFKQGMTTKISLAAERFAPNQRWHIDTMLRMLKLAGNFVREEVLAGFIRLVAQTTELHQYTVQKLYGALKQDISQEGLVLASVWVIGEYGDVLVSSGNFEEEEGVVIEVSDVLVIRLLESILLGPYSNQVTREYVMTALMKLSSRLSDSNAQVKIKELLHQHTVSMEVEIQQRAVEYTNLFSHDSIRPAVLERMPIPEARTIIQATKSGPTRQNSTSVVGPSDQDLLLDLMGVGTSGGGDGSGNLMEQTDVMSSPLATTSPTVVPETNKASNVDLLADLFGGSPAPTTTAVTTTTMAPTTNNDLMDLLGGATSKTNTEPSPQTATNTGLDSLDSLGQVLPSSTNAADYEAYTKNGLSVRLAPSRDRTNPNIINIQILFFNNGSQGTISNLQFQAAVPKSQRLQLNAASNTVVQPNTTEKQLMRINNPQQTAVKLRLRISYEVGGEKKDDIAQYGPFPEGAF